jgi:hypothetical protein
MPVLPGAKRHCPRGCSGVSALVEIREADAFGSAAHSSVSPLPNALTQNFVASLLDVVPLDSRWRFPFTP